MRILVDIGHPAHVHFFKYAIRKWQKNGHQVLITVRPKQVVQDLLEHFGFSYQTLTGVARRKFGLMWEFLSREWHLGRVIQDFKPDVITAIGGIFISPVAKLFKIPSVVFTDTEHVKMDRILTYPLASRIYTPEWFQHEIGKNQVRYRGFQECAYLDPDIYTPDPEVLRTAGLCEEEQFAVLRFISWQAGHDLGQSGFSPDQKRLLVKILSKKMKVLLSVEGEVPVDLKPYLYPGPPERMHDLLYYSSIYIGEGATMATEAGLLGTSSIYVSSLVGSMGNFIELSRSELVYAFQDGESGIEKARDIIADGSNQQLKAERRREVFSRFDDVTSLVTNDVIKLAESSHLKKTLPD